TKRQTRSGRSGSSNFQNPTMTQTQAHPRQEDCSSRWKQPSRHFSEEEHMHEQYHIRSTSGTCVAEAAPYCCSCSSADPMMSATSPVGCYCCCPTRVERRRRSRRRDQDEVQREKSSSASRSVTRGSRRRRQGAGLATTVLFASSTAAASAAAATAASSSRDIPSSRMASRSASLHRHHRRGVAFASPAGIAEPIGRWAAAGCRRLASDMTQHGAAAVTAGVRSRATRFLLRGGLRDRSGDADGGDGSSTAAASRRGLRMIAGGFSGDFMPQDESWKRGRKAPRQEHNERTGDGGGGGGDGTPLASSQSDIGSPSDASASEEDEVYSWAPKQNGQGSSDGGGGAAAATLRRAEDTTPVWRVDLKRGVYTGDVKVKQPLGLDLAECSGGVCVSRVRAGSSAERQGVRAGDRIVATSATLGDVLWEKNTVDGILSAVGTRLVFSNTVTLRVERALDAQQLAAARFRESVTQTYEVILQRPPGLILEQVWDPAGSGQADSVVVAGIVPGSPAESSGAVECGDKVVAVSSSIGNIMWPYRQLEGALSAIERHIGSTINIRFQRTVQMGAWKDPSNTDTDRTIDSTLKVFRERDVAVATSTGAGPLAAAAAAAKNAGFDVDGGRRVNRGSAAVAVGTSAGAAGGRGAVGALSAQDDEARTIVLERCGALARSYGAKRQAIAVDNLLASMVKAGVQMNARFLNNALMAYLSCGEPQKAVDTFHAVTGIIWPDLPPWPDATSGKVRARARQQKKAAAAAADGATSDTDTAEEEAAAARAAAADQFPEDFRLLRAGPSTADEEALEASSWEGTGGQRFLQMRAVAEQAEGGGSVTPVASRAVAVGVDTAAAGGGPLKRPALGEYVGGCRPNGMLVATVVKAHGRRRRIDDACRVVLRMVDWGIKPDVAVFNSLAAAAVWNGRMDLALQVVLGGMMQAWGVSPNQLSYNTIMDAYAREGNVENVVKIYNFMQGEGIAPDVVTTTIVVKAQVGSGDVDAGARTLIEMMKVSNLRDKLDAFPFNTIIKGLMKTLEWEKAMDLFRGMRYHNVKPNLLTFNTLMAGLNKAHVPAVTLELYDEMMEVGGIAPDVYTYSSLVTAYARLGDVEKAVKTLSDMSKSGVKPNRFTLSSVMQACIKGGQPKTALQVHRQLTKSGAVPTDEVIATLLVQAHAMMGDFDEAFHSIAAMGKSGQDNKIAFNHLIKECVLAGEFDKASQAITRMVHQGKRGRGIRFDYNTFNAVSEVPRGYDGTEVAAWPRLTFLMKTKDIVLEKKWEYSSTLYLAILYECMARQDYAMADMVVEERKAGLVHVHPAHRGEVAEVEEKIGFKLNLR
ncbi:unnamed protein product, partial [Ectocarpus sp. 12 AP-2014]